MGAGVEMPVKSVSSARRAGAALEVRLLGPLMVRRDGVTVELPPSRKVRALIAYLAMAPHAAPRSHLCELLWDTPDDPRAELRWCLSRMRSILGPGQRLVSHDDTVRLDLTGCRVDALELVDVVRGGLADLAIEQCRALAALYSGDFLQGTEIDGSAQFSAWLTAQRHRFLDHRVELLQQLATRAPEDEALQHLEAWRQLAPYDLKVHQLLLGGLVRRGRVREAEEHLHAAVRLFEDEGVDSAPLHAAWFAARSASVLPAASAATALTEGMADRERPVVEPRRASIAVMPFEDLTVRPGQPGGPAEALAYDIITRLAKLRSLFVIAQGTMFALKARGVGSEEAGRMLGVDYVISGALRHDGDQLIVTVELVEARAARIVWAEVLKQRQRDALLVLDEIGNRIVASIASEIEALERNRAVLKPPSSLDAWESHHRGLWHMYRFSRPDNEQARHFFDAAVRLDPTFSRAYAGLSFTHFQGAFQGWEERTAAVNRAFETAGQSLMADDRDPAAHWAMGRALWLRGQQEQSVGELLQAVDLSPNFALGHYTLAFVLSQAGDAGAAIDASDMSRSLSPYDPLLFGMLGARAMALVRLGRFEEAASCAVQAAARPNAHVHIRAIAAFSLALAGSLEAARSNAATIRQSDPRYSVADFFRAFRFDTEGEAMFRRGARRIGMG